MQVSFSSAFFFNILRHESRLVSRGIKYTHMYLFSRALVRPQRFVFAAGIVADHGVRGVKNILCGPVILFQLYNKSVGIDLFKIQNVADISSPESVDGLIVVADDAQISVFAGKEPYKFKLRVIGVLILVHHDIAETVLIDSQNFIMGVEQFNSQHEKIVKVNCVVFAEPLLIFVIRVRDPLAAKAHAGVFFSVLKGRDQLILG